jgi:hypothetical protein
MLVVTNTHPPLSLVCQQMPHPLAFAPFTPHSSNYIIYIDDINNLGRPRPENNPLLTYLYTICTNHPICSFPFFLKACLVCSKKCLSSHLYFVVLFEYLYPSHSHSGHPRTLFCYVASDAIPSLVYEPGGIYPLL